MTGQGAYQNYKGGALPVVARDPPPEGQKVGTLLRVLTPTDFAQSQYYDLAQAAMSQVRTLFVDNSQNGQVLNVSHGVNGQTTIVPAGGGAIIPTTSNGSNYFYSFNVATAPTLPIDVTFAFYNYEIPPALWGTTVITVTQTIPIGSILIWYGTAATIPVGYGLCDGTIYNRSDGAGTIASPNLVGFFVMGANAAVQGQVGGSTTITQANLPVYNLTVTDAGHNHTHTDPGHTHTPTVGGSLLDVNSGSGGTAGWQAGLSFSNCQGTGLTTVGTGVTNNAATTGITVNSGGGGAAYNPPYTALCYMIKY